MGLARRVSFLVFNFFLIIYRHANVADDIHCLLRRQDLRENLPRVKDGITCKEY